MNVLQLLRVLVLPLVVLLPGCNGVEVYSNAGNDRLSAPLGTISIYQLAGRLGMSVTGNSRSVATLRDSANIVMIYGDPAGQAYVNGAPVGEPGGIVPVGGIFFLPDRLESDIRPMLRIPERNRPGRPSVTPARPRRRIACVVIDPGHGGKDCGAVGVVGTHEKTIALDTALTTAKLLRDTEASVVLTRSGDTFVELNERAEIANRRRADIFVSIHADSARKRAARGHTVYVARSASPDSLRLARTIDGHLGSLGLVGRGVRRADYRVLVRTTGPAVLVELGYLSNASESALLARDSYRERLAGAISEGILEYLRP